MKVADISGKRLRAALRPCSSSLPAAIVLAINLCIGIQAQTAPVRQQSSVNSNQPTATQDKVSSAEFQAEAEFQTGTALTRRGSFHEAIPHLLVARTLA